MRHLLHCFQRVFAHRCLGTQHDGIGAVEHRISHITHLGAGGHGVGDHALHHLGRSDGDFVHFPRHFDHAFLQRWHCGVTYLDRQVTTRNHDAVAGGQNFFQMWNGLKAFDLGNQPRLMLERLGSYIAQLARHFHVCRAFGEAHRHVVSLEGHGGFDVLHVFGGKRWCRQTAALFVDAFVVGQLAAHLHCGVYLLAFDDVNGKHNQAIVEQQQVAGFNVSWQFFVVQTHPLQVTKFSA